MDIAEKRDIVESIVQRINENGHFYVTDIEALNAESTSKLRRKCFENDIEIVVVKNTLLRKALEQVNAAEFEEMFGVLKGTTSVLFCKTANVPAKLIKELRNEGLSKPVLKAAFAQQSVYVGDDQLDSLVSIKSREELIGDIVLLLQSPMQKVIGALESGKNTIAGVVKTLSEKE